MFMEEKHRLADKASIIPSIASSKPMVMKSFVKHVNVNISIYRFNSKVMFMQLIA